jgi:adenine phosphoribosyltransferase
MHVDSVKPGMRVLVHDDLLATGGQRRPLPNSCACRGTWPPGSAFLIELSFLQGVDRLKPYNAQIIPALLTY